jgi:transcriptional repressor of cell division inhibition gene dicB
MLTEQVISHFGSATAVAEALKISISAVSQWGERVPPLRAAQIAHLTDGRIPFDLGEYTGWNKPAPTRRKRRHS